MASSKCQSRPSTVEVVETCLHGDSDQSGEEPSEEESVVSSFDSEEEEERFLEEGGIVLDEPSSNEEWEPETSVARKLPHGAVQERSSEESEDEPQRSTSRRASSSRRSRGRGRASGKASSTSRLPEERWFGVSDPDIIPVQPTFRPAHTPGPKLIHTASYTPLQLFQLYFTNSVIQTIVTNSNEYGRVHYSTPSSPWVDITLQDMFSFMSLVIYMGLLKCSTFADYWRGGKLYSLPFPRSVMSGTKFRHINRSVHMSSGAADAANDRRRGTATYDRLCKIKPLYEEIRDACKCNYHPGQEIAVDERMVASKARIGLKQYMKNKPVRWGYKLFVLADSKTGYTWDFFVYEGKRWSGGKGVSYDSVMELVNTRLLGTGYKLFVDNFYTSPALFRDLLRRRIWACGTIRTNRDGYPNTRVNSLDSRSPRGSIRWIRKDSLLFVQWKDTRDVCLCSSLHTAHGQETVSRRVRGDDGQWTKKDIPVPPAVKEYNLWMGGVDISDALITYYKVLHKTRRWYKTFFYHFMDIAIVNAFILQKELARGKGEQPLTQKAFRETLAAQLSEAGSPTTVKTAPSAATPGPSASAANHHRLVHISGDSTKGRLRCRQCHLKTPVKCATCEAPLCFVPARDCYNSWHVARGL